MPKCVVLLSSRKKYPESGNRPSTWLINHISASVIFILLTGSSLNASESPFSFLDKAIRHYQIVKSSAGSQAGENAIIDSLLKVDAMVNDFNKASDLSWKIGLYLLEQGKHADALDIFLDLRHTMELKQGKTGNEQKKMSSVLNIIGAIYEETGLWNEALALYMNSLQICNEINYQLGKAKIYNNIGKIYFNRNEMGKAEGLFNKAIDINKKLNIKSELFNNYNNLGGVYKKMNNLDKALEYALLALNQLDMNHDFYDLSIVYSNIGNLYQDMKNYPVSLTYYQEAASIQRHKLYKGALIRSLLSMASLYQLMNNPRSATECISEALTTADLLGNPSQKLIVLQEAAQYYNKNQDFRRAAVFYADYVTLNDSLEALNSLTKIEQIQSVYEVINKEKDNKILQQRVNLQELALQRQRIVLLAALIIFLVLAFFLFNLQRNRQRERKNNALIAKQTELLYQKEKEILLQEEQNLKLELDYKNRQLTSYALHLARNNEFISKTSNELKQILLGISPRDVERSNRVRDMLSDLQQYSAGNDWEEFRLYFEEVHQSFEKNLTTAFPDLTSNDKKFCALLKLGLSTKDIASITFREIRSVESARNRLRKKLNLSADVNINNFLSQF